MSNNAQQQGSAPWLALASICIATFLVPLSMSALNLALPAMSKELNADAVLVSWVPTINLWGSMVLMLPAGKIADMVGRKQVYLIGVLFFSLASLLVLVINTIEWVLIIRVLQGFASAAIFATAVAIVSTLFSEKNRGMALGLTSTSVYLGLTCGPLIGGWLTEVAGWRSVFWAPVPITLVAMLFVIAYVRSDRKQQAAGRLDWLGSVLFAGWTTAFFLGLSGLPDPAYIGLVVVGLVLLFLFLRQQGQSPHPLVRLKAVANNRIFSRSLMASLFMYGAHYPVLFLLSLYLQYIQGMSPSESGQLILLQALIMALLAPFAGRLSDRYQPRLIASVGCLVYGLGFALLMFIGKGTSPSYIAVALIILGVGFGLFSSPNTNAALSSVPSDRLSIASALMNLARTLGNMFSMAVVVLLFNMLLGNQAIEPESYDQLLSVIRYSLLLACGYTLVAAYNSYMRGNLVRD